MQALPRAPEPIAVAEPAPIVIVGTGPVGMRVAEELLRRDPACPIVLYGDEPWEPYQRVRLSSLLLGDIGWTSIENRLVLPRAHRVEQRHHCAVTAIDAKRHWIRDASGRVQPYGALVLATGSRAHVPQIPGIEKPGVYTFRDLSDVQRLMARSVRSRTTVVLGGGLLGLEAARALRRRHTEVVVVQHAPRLMNRQLDGQAAELLQRRVETLGIRVVLSDSIAEIRGEERVQSVRLLGGAVIACDTLVLAAGIRANTDLALAAGLGIGRGILVDDALRTRDPSVYAAGECAEHRGQVIGLVAPGLEQAAVVAHNLLGGEARFHARVSPAQLKVVGLPVFSIGEVGDDEGPSHRVVVHARVDAEVYRRLVFAGRRLVGAVAVGEWSELARLQEAVTHRRRLGWLQRVRFARTGMLWGAENGEGVAAWAATATVCNCAGVTRGALTAAIERGCTTVQCLSAATSAARVCGSCRPLLEELLGHAGTAAIPLRSQRALSLVAGLTLFLLVLFAWPGGIPPSESVQGGWKPDALWTDGVWKQVSGYTLLALALAAVPLSLRKRWRHFSAGDFGAWRVTHSALGTMALLVLIAHTGLHLGQNLNLYLMLSFLALTKAGSLAAAAVSLEARPNRWSKRARTASTWLHILFVWPLPALLGFHILSVYYF